MELPDHDCPLRPIVLAQAKLIEEQGKALAAYAGIDAKVDEVRAENRDLRAKLETTLAHIEKLE